jgi:hypothetical protein
VKWKTSPLPCSLCVLVVKEEEKFGRCQRTTDERDHVVCGVSIDALLYAPFLDCGCVMGVKEGQSLVEVEGGVLGESYCGINKPKPKTSHSGKFS